MFSRSSLLLVTIALLSLSMISAKEKGFYLPVIGYTAASARQSSCHIHCLQLGFIGYSFSNDFRLELTGLGCLENILMINKPYPIHSDNKPALEIPPTTMPSLTESQIKNIFQYSPDLEESSSQHTHISRLPTNSIPIPTTPLEECMDLEKRAWEGRKTPTQPTVTEGTTVPSNTHQVPQIAPNSPSTSFQGNAIPTTPKPLVQSTQPTPANTQTVTNNQNTETQPDTPISERVIWGGVALMGKCTLLRPHPRCYIYWGPGIAVLHPFHKDMHSTVWLTLSMGIQWIVNSKLTIDICGTTTDIFGIKTRWGTTETSNSLFYQSKPQLLKIALQWYL